MTDLLLILLGTVLIGSMMLADDEAARGFGASQWKTSIGVPAVLALSSVLSYLVHRHLLDPFGLDYLRTPALLAVAVAAAAACGRAWRSPEMPDLLQLITIQCAVLGIALVTVDLADTFSAALQLGLGTAFALAAVQLAFAALRRRIREADVPAAFRGLPVTCITLGIAGLGLLGLTGLIRIH